MADGKVSPGDDFNPPPAVIWNNMVDAGTAWANSRRNSTAPNPIRPRETDIIKVKNDSGAVRKLGEILRISGKAIETVSDENKWLVGVEPTDDGYFGILKEPAENGALASLQVSGCCMALVNVTDADHKRATSADADYVLQSGDDGPIEILFAPDGTGEKTCVVRFAGGGGSGGTHEIWFEVLSVTCEADGRKVLYCEPVDYTGSCTGSIPGEDEYGNVEVTAKCDGLDPYPVEWLEAGGRVGRATWFFPRGAEYCEARWLLDKICGSPQCGGD